MEFHTFTDEYVRSLTNGDPEVERHFVAYFSELLLIKLRRAVRSHQAIEDVRQETFLRVFRVLKQRRGPEDPGKLGAFVNGVCNNVLAEHYRSVSRMAPLSGQGFDAPAPGPDPEAGCANEEGKRTVRQILDRLPAKDRQILRLIFLEEREKDEVCRICHVNRSYLRVLVHRAKNRFRESAPKTHAASSGSMST